MFLFHTYTLHYTRLQNVFICDTLNYKFSLCFTHTLTYSSVRERKALAARDCRRRVLMVALHVAREGCSQRGECVVD